MQLLLEEFCQHFAIMLEATILKIYDNEVGKSHKVKAKFYYFFQD